MSSDRNEETLCGQNIQETVRSFGRCAAGVSIVCRPRNIPEAAEVFAMARRLGRRVTIRGGGHSFHSQAVHDGDTGVHIILNTDCLENKTIMYNPAGDMVTLGSGVAWSDFVDQAILRARERHEPIRLPGSMQTGGTATVGGTLNGDCLSRFSATMGKESRWIDSFKLLTTTGDLLDVSLTSNPDLFNAVIGGHGYIGLVVEATYKLIAIDRGSCAHTKISTYSTFAELIGAQIQLITNSLADPASPPHAISSAWFTDPLELPFDPNRIKAGVFNSTYALPSTPRLPGFPLYSDIRSDTRYLIEVLAREELPNLWIHQLLFAMAQANKKGFENDLKDFIFFMDGNTLAKEKFEKLNFPDQFPIVQQTYVMKSDKTEAFAKICEGRLKARNMRPTESDMLFVAQDDCLMSANYHMDGFAVTIGFEPDAPKGCPADKITKLLRELSVDCMNLGGRIHLVKNVYADFAVLRQMFSPQIVEFERIKRQFDPYLLLQNTFSDHLFVFVKF